MKKASLTERVKMVKAMEYVARQINDETVLEPWFMGGVADDDIEYGDLESAAGPEVEWYTDDGTFADLMACFLRVMAAAKKSGGLYCDGVVSQEAD